MKVRLIFTWILGLWLGGVVSFSSAASGSNSITLTQSDAGIQLEVREIWLGEVLQRITRQSGIRFIIRGDLKQDLVTGSYQARDWSGLTKKLLSNYSRMELGGEQGRLSTVRIFASGNPAHSPGEQTIATVVDALPSPSASALRKPALNEKSTGAELNHDQLLVLGRLPVRQAIPMDLWNNPPFRTFLAQHGISESDDLKQSHKILQVRGAARQRLRDLTFHH